jgi:hypothetical protein
MRDPPGRRGPWYGPFASAAAVAVLAGLAAPVLVGTPLRGGALQLLTAMDVWLLAVFAAGMLALLLAAAVAVDGAVPGRAARRGLGRITGRGVAEPMQEGPESEDEAEGVSRAGHAAAARWMAETGAWLLLAYMAGWLTTR